MFDKFFSALVGAVVGLLMAVWICHSHTFPRMAHAANAMASLQSKKIYVTMGSDRSLYLWVESERLSVPINYQTLLDLEAKNVPTR